MRVLEVTLRDFRGYDQARGELGAGLTVISGPNGAGKTNLLEGIYFGCTGRSCRTVVEREVVRFQTSTARVVIAAEGEDGRHELMVGVTPGQPKRMRFDGAQVDRLLDLPTRPLVSVFLPDRLELVKGPPALRRAHLDQLVAALWPARVQTRRSYAQVLAQRNALLQRVRTGSAGRGALTAWDEQLARAGVALMRDRVQAVDTIAGRFADLAAALHLEGASSIAYRPRSQATEAAQLAAELAGRLDSDLERGFTGHGPHRDELVLRHQGRDLRAYGSQGQQRLALLALLLAERDSLIAHRHAPPVMLLDDVMSELDATRRRALVDLLREGGGQSVITATDIDHVPGGEDAEVTRIAVSGHCLAQEMLAA